MIKIDGKYKWLARDESGRLYAYEEKPTKMVVSWFVATGDWKSLKGLEGHYSFIKWEDKEPTSVREAENILVLSNQFSKITQPTQLFNKSFQPTDETVLLSRQSYDKLKSIQTLVDKYFKLPVPYSTSTDHPNGSITTERKINGQKLKLTEEDIINIIKEVNKKTPYGESMLSELIEPTDTFQAFHLKVKTEQMKEEIETIERKLEYYRNQTMAFNHLDKRAKKNFHFNHI